MVKPKLHLIGMMGLGDTIHERAILKKLIPHYDIWLETSWPSVFHDLPIHCVRKPSRLRTQEKNASREAHLYEELPPCDEVRRVWYRPEDVRRENSVLLAMAANVRVDSQELDYSLPVPEEWALPIPDKPILVYRPLIVRTEWGGCERRNPDLNAYKELLEHIRKDYFVISVADLVPGREWMVSHPIEADLEYHSGELSFNQLAYLVSKAKITFNSPGFMTILSRSVGTPNICVFGGYENSNSFRVGTSPYLGIDPIKSCQCFSHHHSCDKRIDIDQAKTKMDDFLCSLK